MSDASRVPSRYTSRPPRVSECSAETTVRPLRSSSSTASEPHPGLGSGFDPTRPPVVSPPSRDHAVSTAGRQKENTKAGDVLFGAMAPLLLENEAQWTEFGQMLEVAKKMGVETISTDVWWGLVEPRDQAFDFTYYDRMADAVEKAGLRWVPILSFHQCGGNVGDNVNIPLPSFLAEKYATDGRDKDSLFSKSEQGNINREVISPWASQRALSDFQEMMQSFKDHFSPRAHLIEEINISLGPAGELRYPSYNAHDKGSDYPSRGALQAYSDDAQESFRRFAMDRYGSVEKVGQAWGVKLSNREDIRPPDHAEAFFARNDQFIAYGQDLFDWYHGSLMAHGKLLMQTAMEIFWSEGSAFTDVELAAKAPGVHWNGEREAELNAGLIASSQAGEWNDIQHGHGYEDLVDLFRELREESGTGKGPVLHFTCLEMDDRDDGIFSSKAKTLVHAVGEEAREQGVPLGGENALAVNLWSPPGWQHMANALRGHYTRLTLLRVSDLVHPDNWAARDGFGAIKGEFDGGVVASSQIPPS